MRPNGAAASDRAVSTVLDAGLFLLLAGVAVGVLLGAPGQDGSAAAEHGAAAPDTASTLASTTTTVRYAPAGTDRTSSDRGSVAGLLARAAVANASADDAPLTPDDAYVAAVRNGTADVLDQLHADGGVQVHARWTPLPGADPTGEVDVGPAPPPGADVHAATVVVPVGSAASPGTAPGTGSDAEGPRADGSLASVAERSGCSGLGRAVAEHAVATLFPPARTAAALREDGAAGQVERRYRRAAAATSADPARLTGDDVGARERNAALADALAGEFERACRAQPDVPTAARRASPGEVTVVVRTWSP